MKQKTTSIKMVMVTVGGESYYMNPKVKEKWDSIKDGKLTKRDEDKVYIFDGRERVGKSVLALQQACYIDPSLVNEMNRITFTPEETLKAIRETKSTKTETKCIIFDEAFRGLSSKGAISKTNKKIVQAMMEMGQNNLVLFLVSPSFYLLELYSAVLRSNALFHIIKKKDGRRGFRVFNYKKKAILYRGGAKKGWGYNLGTKINDNFPNKYPGGKSFEGRYRKLKYDSIRSMDDGDEKENKVDINEQRNSMIKILREKNKMSYQSIVDFLEGTDMALAKTTIARICKGMPLNTPKIIPSQVPNNII